jgi:hypothetical protein
MVREEERESKERDNKYENELQEASTNRANNPRKHKNGKANYVQVYNNDRCPSDSKEKG